MVLDITKQYGIVLWYLTHRIYCLFIKQYQDLRPVDSSHTVVPAQDRSRKSQTVEEKSDTGVHRLSRATTEKEKDTPVIKIT